jgi:SET domain-containing protein
MEGLNMIAVRDIQQNEELTLDYAYFLDKTMEPFNCNCGAEKCRGVIGGKTVDG